MITMPKVIDIRKQGKNIPGKKTIRLDGKEDEPEQQIPVEPITAKPESFIAKFAHIMVYDIMHKVKPDTPKPIEQEKFERYERFIELAEGRR